MFNKGLEMIEARWLFDIPMEKVDVIVHPQSIVHSLVEFVDGSILAQLSSSDMCFPIQYAVTWPDRLPNSLPHLDLARIASLKFEAPRWDDFPALTLARTAGLTGGTMPAMYNAANEVAVQAFVDGKLSFPGIWETVEKVLSNARPRDYKGQLPIILEDDAWAREEALRML
jgi:1-deoxy-D-xylulose-5-phosphate reductoisomerase